MLLAVLLLTFHLQALAQAPAWQSAQAVAAATAAVAGNFTEVTATAVDAAGNVYLAGVFANSIVLGGTTLASSGNGDVFVAKFNPAINQFVWAQRAGGLGDDGASALAVSGTSVYVAGSFKSSTAGFGSSNLTNAGAADVFVAKLTDAGNFLWAQRAGGTGYDQATALAVSGVNVYVAGSFNSSTASIGTTTIDSAGSYDAFVAKFVDAGSMGSLAWVQRAGGIGYDYAQALAVSGTSVYVAGSFGNSTTGSSTADFGPVLLTYAGANDVFVAKLTDAGSAGTFVWAQRAGGTGYDYAQALAVSSTGVYVAGSFESPTAVFGPITLTNTGISNVFVAKLTDAGNTGSFVWAQRAGGTNEDYAYALAVKGTSVYVAGIFTSATVSFGTTTLTNASVNIADVFVAKLTDAGNTSSFAWAQQAGGTDDDYTTALALSGTSMYVVGYFVSPSAGFGVTTLPNTNYPGPLGFLASLTDPTLTATTPALPREPAALFPNPAHHAATLRLPAGTAPVPLTLTDAQGRPVRRYPAPAGPEAALDLQGLPAGLYLLRGAGPAQRLAVE